MTRTLLGGIAILAALTLGGCAAATGTGDSAEPSFGIEGPAGLDGGAGPSGGFATDEAAAARGETASDADRSVVTTGTMTLTVADPADAARDATRIVEAAGGRVDARSEQAPDGRGDGRAQLALRIPAEAVTSTLEELRALGRADSVTIAATDVTVERQDVEARVTALRASLGRLAALLAEAADIGDLLAIESEIANRQAELESLEARQRHLVDQVAMSTISLEIRTEAEAPSALPGDFGEGLVTGWAAFAAFWSGALVVLGILVPWLVAAGVVALLLVILLRRRARRARGDG